MGRALGIDVGSKRVGIALSDSMKMFGSPKETVLYPNIFVYIKSIIPEQEIDTFVVGYPTNLDGSPTDATELVLQFIEKLKKLYPHIPVHKIDERFTSKMAKQSIIDSGTKKKKRRDKALVDTVSAAIILQSYLDQK